MKKNKATFQKSNLLDQIKRSGLSIMEVCSRAGLTYNRFYLSLREGRIDRDTEQKVMEILSEGTN